jgi:hypothetical protein
MNFRQRGITLILIIGVIGLLLAKTFANLLTEIWWFDSIGFTQVFWTRLVWQTILWIFTFVIYAIFLWGNYWIASSSKVGTLRFLENTELEIYSKQISNFAAGVLIFFCSISAAIATASQWEILLKYLHSANFGNSDPIFDRDISFYVFQLPFYESIWKWLLILFCLGFLLSSAVYIIEETIYVARNRRIVFIAKAKIHLSLLLAAIAIEIAIRFWLQRYQLLFSTEGSAFGAGYTDVHARLFACQAMTVLLLGVAIIFLLSIRRPTFILPIGTIALSGAAFVLLNFFYPLFVQQFIVEPNELIKEKPYIENNIKFTQKAYGLEEVQRQDFAAEAQLDRQQLAQNQLTIDNIRLWDYRPLLSTYRQLQEIRLYYRFSDADIDRYTVNGDYQQVMLSARELVSSQLPQEAQTWVNQRLKYTHGYGLVMSPVKEVTPDGLPILYIKDIPPVSTVDIQINQPAIYYGEETKDYIFTGTKTKEFDYPVGDENALTNYRGKGGVSLGSFWRRLVYAYDLSSIQVLISNYFSDSSYIHYYRQISERVQHIAPFLKFDRDPYLVVINGRLQWIIDAYTVSDRYPYSEPVTQSELAADILGGERSIEEFFPTKTNYIRNSVKVLIDAYDGTLRFFAVDETDPVLQTYRQIFPNLFESSQTVPPEVKAHFRYPIDLFTIQAQIYLSYHMSDPEVFYNREDLWRLPIQNYEGQDRAIEPYYTIARLPGENSEEFIMILSFTPSNKDNMIAWMAARSNGKEYGKLLLYEFPKQKLVFGPRQIQARIDQDPNISQQFTLWDQSGSKVIRGDLLVIPIEQSLLYVEPIYLRAERGELPELTRVIVAYDRKIVMQETLEQSLTAIFGGTKTLEEKISLPSDPETTNLIKSALVTHQKAEAAARQGNWSDYERYQQELGLILRKLSEKNDKLP